MSIAQRKFKVFTLATHSILAIKTDAVVSFNFGRRLTTEITKLVTEMKNGQETESHLSLQLASERKNMDSTAKSLTNCEALLKKLTDKNEQLGRENTTLADNV